jgi:hypothetical protein
VRRALAAVALATSTIGGCFDQPPPTRASLEKRGFVVPAEAADLRIHLWEFATDSVVAVRFRVPAGTALGGLPAEDAGRFAGLLGCGRDVPPWFTPAMAPDRTRCADGAAVIVDRSGEVWTVYLLALQT